MKVGLQVEGLFMRCSNTLGLFCLVAVLASTLARSSFALQTDEELKKVEALFGDIEVAKPEPKKPPKKEPAKEERKAAGGDLPPALPAPMAAGAVPIDNGVQDAIAKVLKVELAFLRRAANLTEEQESMVAKLDAKWMKKNVRPPINDVMNGVVVNFGDGRVAVSSIQKSVVRALIKEFEPMLTKEQMEAYAAERKARDRFAADANIDGVLLLLDKELCLREEQKINLRKALQLQGMVKWIFECIYRIRDIFRRCRKPRS